MSKKASLPIIILFSVLTFWSLIIIKLGLPPHLDLGSLSILTEKLELAWLLYISTGTALIFSLSQIINIASASAFQSEKINYRRICVTLAVYSLVAPYIFRKLIFHDMPITDDEGVYLFTARILSEGNLWIESFPIHRAFDHIFMINDGRMFGQYFIGWPLLMAPTAKIDLHAFMPSIFSALSIAPLAMILKTYLPFSWQVAGLIVYFFSASTIGMASTLLSHSACTFFILCFIFLSIKIADKNNRNFKLHSFLAALAISIAFFIRPSTALIISLPFIFFILKETLYLDKIRAAHSFLMFIAAALPLSLFFLYANQEIYKNPLSTGYQYFYSFDKSLGFKYFPERAYYVGDTILETIKSPLLYISIVDDAFFRISVDGLGWPIHYILVILSLYSLRSSKAWPFFTAVIICVFFHAAMRDLGIDTFTPFHLFEAIPLLLVSSLIGAFRACQNRKFTSALSKALPSLNKLEFNPISVAIATVFASYILISPLRAINIFYITKNISSPHVAASKIPGEIIIFTRTPFVEQKNTPYARHFLFHQPVNRPDFSDRVIWANDLGAEKNKEVLRHFPNRTGYKLYWKAGNPVILPIK